MCIDVEYIYTKKIDYVVSNWLLRGYQSRSNFVTLSISIFTLSSLKIYIYIFLSEHFHSLCISCNMRIRFVSQLTDCFTLYIIYTLHCVFIQLSLSFSRIYTKILYIYSTLSCYIVLYTYEYKCKSMWNYSRAHIKECEKIRDMLRQTCI